jgi:ParB family transcriptional regulator, chromosome partitioning protein
MMRANVAAHIDEIVSVDAASVLIGPRLRPIRESVVDELVASIKALGLIYPITVTASWGRSPTLVAGAHRLAAAKKLGWAEIPCRTVDAADTDTFALIEIDENLTRGDLSQAERAIHIAKRKEIYERLHPETKHGGTPGAGRGKAHKDANFASFSDDTAAKTGRSERSVTQMPRAPSIFRRSLRSSVPRWTRVKSSTHSRSLRRRFRPLS